MNLSAGGTMVLADAPSEKAITLARQAARAIGLRVAAIDMFVDIGGEPDAIEIIEVNSNPSIRLLEDSDRGDLILKIWHHTFSPWDCCSVRPAEIRRRHLPRAHGRVAGSARNRSRAAAAHLGGGDRLERQGQHGGDVRSNRPRLWPAHRPVHLAASVSLQRTDSGRWHRDRRRRARSAETAGRSCHRRGLETARREIRRVRSAVCAGLPALPGERMRLRCVRGRHRRTLRSGPPRRRARDLRHLGRLRACRIARQLA